MFVNCKGCGAEVTDERKTCPHCNTEIVAAATVALENAADDKERAYISKTVALEQANTHLVEQNKYLQSENVRLHAENEELRKRVTPAAPVETERTGPGVIPISQATATSSAETAKTV